MDLPEPTPKPTAFILCHPGEKYIISSLKNMIVGEVEILPAFRVHRTAKTHSCSAREYARLTHVIWASVHGSHCAESRDSMRGLDAEAFDAVADVIREVQYAVGTAIAQQKSVAMMAPPSLGMDLLRLGYRVKASLYDAEGRPLPHCLEAQAYVAKLPAHRGDPCTGWRQLASLQNCYGDGGEITLENMPPWLAAFTTLI